MNIQQSVSRSMKYEALKWLRLQQRCMFIATEVGAYNSDVLGINEKKMIEVEIKISIQDFKNDFKKYKHNLYSGTYGDSSNQWIPTHFYFAVTEELVEPVKEFLEEVSVMRFPRANQYGVISLKDWTVVKRAGWLHKNPPSNRVKCTTALRMGSELIRFHEAWL
jgi:hypothetical protein